MKTGYILSPYWQLAYNAHRNTSFSPDDRANSYIKEYSEELESDLANMPDHEKQWYKDGYIKKFTAWLGAKSRCISSMITGPARFPVDRARKANESEHNRSIEFTSWRENALKAIKRRIADAEKQPVDHKESVIIDFDGGDIIVNYDLDRIQIKHHEKPTSGVIALLKAHAFKWSPKNQVWQRQLTENGKHAVSIVTGVSYNSILKPL